MSIGQKFTFWVSVVVVVIGLISGVVFYHLEMHQELDVYESMGRKMGPILEQSIVASMMTKQRDAVQKIFQDLAVSETITGIHLIDKDRTVRAGTDKALLGKTLSPAVLKCHGCHERGQGGLFYQLQDNVRYVQHVGNRSECHGCHDARRKFNGVIIFDFSVSEVAKHIRREMTIGYLIFIPTLFVVGLMTVILSRQLVQKRIVALNEGVRSMREGNYSARLPLHNDDEITRFSEAFNDMAGAINERNQEKDILLKQVSDSFEFLRTMMDTIPNPVFYKDAEGRYLGCNRAFEEFLGRSKDEIIGKTVYDMGPKEIADLYYRADRELFGNPGQQCYEWRVQGKNKEVREVIFNKATFPDATGRVAGLIGMITDITQRKRAEEALRESEAKFRTIFENSLDAIRVAKNGIYDYANPAYLALFGYSRQEELRGQAVLDMIALSERPQVERIMQQRTRGEDVPSVYATRGIRRDGTEFDMEVRVSLYTVAGDVFTVANIRDISDRKRHEEIIRHNYDTQTVINTLMKVGLGNISLEEVLQQTLDIILSLPWLSVEAKGCIFLLEEGKKTLVMKAMKGLSECAGSCTAVPLGKCLCGRAALSEDVVYAAAFDERHELCRYAEPEHGHYCVPVLSMGKTLGVLNLYLSEGHARDTMEVEFLDAVAGTLAGIITRKRVEQERESLMQDLDAALIKVIKAHKEWVSTFDSITDMIAIIDRDFLITRVNKAFAQYFGLTPQEVLGKKCHELVHEQGTPLGICPHLETLRHHHTASAEIVDHKRQRIFKTTTFPFYSPQGDVIASIHVSRDITEERNRELRLILNERLASLGQMASGIAHEINNPLAAIGGCAEGLLNRTRQGRIDPELFENYLQIIQEEVMRCSSITGGMLSIVRQSSYETRILNLNELLHKTIELVNFQGRLRSVQVLERYADELPPITGNEGELKQAFLAIVTNALDAMEDSGTLSVETAEKDGRVVVSIEDTGCGIPEEHLGRIFDPFFTLKGGKGGTGLGLSIANKIIGNHKGEISVSSEEGRGSLFTITFTAEKG
ncbi:MAG: PAS domain S-box protein [Thermodesulfovibrionales bacterium]